MSPNIELSHPVEPRTFSTTLGARHHKQRGIAIITVLSVLLLMTVLILAFFKMAQSELRDAQLYSDGVRTTQLTEIVTNMVIGQIREATYTVGSERHTWASQPGAIHRFGLRTNGGGNDFSNMSLGIYKLYSSSQMFKGYSPNRTLALDVPGDWNERTAQYVDLNEPVYNSTSDRLYFPIVDPRGYASDRDDKVVAGNIEGFSYSATNSRNRQIAGVVVPGSGADRQRVPMPVEWFYMLADGTLGTVDLEGKWVADPQNGNVRPTARNPMVARLAFWTDDESAKININTASEGAFWDQPRADSKSERDFGKYQPARNEVYRYPGHVSGISLSTILYPGSGATAVGAKPFLSDDQYEKVIALSPKVRWFPGGSGSGTTKRADPDTSSTQGTVDYAPGSNRLYATIDELLYQGIAEAGGGGATERKLNDIFVSERTRNYFEYGRHSLTVNSNAPEITAHGTPRISLWPMKAVLDNSNQPSPITNPIQVVQHQTYFDRLIAFASTIGQRRYFWQKNTAGSRHGEMYNRSGGQNVELLEYMYELAQTPLPGYGGSFFNKYGDGEFDDGREIMIQIWDYMRNTNLNDPLLTPNHHYNQIDNSYGGGGMSGKQIGRGQIAGSCMCGGTSPHQSRWYKKFSPYGKGHGRAFTLSEVAMIFYCRAQNSDGALKGDLKAAQALDTGEKLIEVALALETFCVTHGFTSIQPKSRIVVAGSSTGGNIETGPESYPKYKIITAGATGQQPAEQFFPPLTGRSGRPGVMARWDDAENYSGKRVWGAHGGVRLFSADLEGATNKNLFLDNKASQASTIFPQGLEKQNGLLVFNTEFEKPPTQDEVSVVRDKAIIVPATATSMDFVGDSQPLAVILYDEGRERNCNVNNLIQLFLIRFDHPDSPGAAIKLPVPTIAEDLKSYTWADRLRQSGKDPKKLISEDHDVSRSVIVTHSDFRLISGRRATNVATPGNGGEWGVHPKYTSTDRHAHTLTAADGTKLPGYNSERGYALSKSGTPLKYPKDLAPDFVGDPTKESFFPRSNAFGTTGYELSVDPGITGDWDNGIGPHIDGPYVNRPDDGTSYAGGKGDSGDPYFDNLGEIDYLDRTFFSPNRVITSAGQLGSLPTGMQDGIPWRTLLFRPDPEHFGARNYPNPGDPPDHAMLDFFWMPTVEPFPISQPFATMGKVNMNYQMAPFDYIKRKTALHAVMKDQRMLAIDNKSVDTYKKKGGSGNYRYPIDIPVTLLQFEDRFDKGEVFRSASEICEIYMVPQGASGAPADRNTMGTPQRASKGSKGFDYPAMREFWKSYGLTGDNSKERTYTNLYPRLTTKSNVFQTHMIVESIQKSRAVEHDIFDPDEDNIMGRWRGSAVIERNIDPDLVKPSSSVPDYTQTTNASLHTLESMEKLYAYRVLNVKQFNP